VSGKKLDSLPADPCFRDIGADALVAEKMADIIVNRVACQAQPPDGSCYPERQGDVLEGYLLNSPWLCSGGNEDRLSL
jgi:hypothetical protein